MAPPYMQRHVAEHFAREGDISRLQKTVVSLAITNKVNRSPETVDVTLDQEELGQVWGQIRNYWTQNNPLTFAAEKSDSIWRDSENRPCQLDFQDHFFSINGVRHSSKDGLFMVHPTRFTSIETLVGVTYDKVHGIALHSLTSAVEKLCQYGERFVFELTVDGAIPT